MFVPDFINSSQTTAEKPLIRYMHLSYLNAHLYTRMHIASWRPYLIKSENCSTCSNYRSCMIDCIRLISSQARAEKPLITYMHFSYLNAHFYTFMQIAPWQPYLIESENCSTCSNYRCFVIVCTRLH